MIKLRFNIPASFYMAGKSAESLDAKTSFYSNGINWTLSFCGEDIVYLKSQPENKRFAKEIKSIQIETSLENNRELVNRLCEQDNRKELSEIILAIGNRCINAMRNMGRVCNFTPYSISPGIGSTLFFFHWSVEINREGNYWESVIPNSKDIDELLLLVGKEKPPGTADFYVENWILVEEFIQHDIEFPPEFVFSANAVENYQNKNYRVSLLEAIIGLEIVISKYIKAYFTDYKRFQKFMFEKLDSPNLTLSMKVPGILQLMLDKQGAETFDWKIIKSAIGWRNEIMHRSGTFKRGIEPQEIQEGILAIINLSIFLGYETEKLRAYHSLIEIQSQVKKENSLEHLSLELKNRHSIWATSILIETSEIPPKELIIKVAEDLGRLLAQRDKIFNPQKHLLLEFRKFDFDSSPAVWFAGKLISYPNK